MSDNTQKRITQAIALGVHNAVVNHKMGVHSLVIDTEYSNQGVFSAPTKDELVAPRRVSFGFHGGYATFKDANGAAARTVAYMEYSKPETVDAGVSKVVAFLLERS